MILMQFRVSSWNVNNRNFRETHAELLRRVDTDLLALQEVSGGFYEKLTDTGIFDWFAFSLSLRPPRPEQGTFPSLRLCGIRAVAVSNLFRSASRGTAVPGTSIDRQNQFGLGDDDVQFSHAARLELGKN